LDAYLIPQLRSIIDSYDDSVPTTIEELWATGLGADPLTAYLARRQAYLGVHLLGPMSALASEYGEAPTAEELLATDVIADPWVEPVPLRKISQPDITRYTVIPSNVRDHVIPALACFPRLSPPDNSSTTSEVVLLLFLPAQMSNLYSL
jgi:hypothetical protein